MIRQILSIVAINLRSLPARWAASTVVVVGVAGVVGVMVAVLAMAEGFEKTFASAARNERVVILRAGAVTEVSSYIKRAEAELLLAGPGLARDNAGNTLASSERFFVTVLPVKTGDGYANVVLRGVGDNVLKVRPEVGIFEGRMFRPGLRELMVGRRAQQEFAGLKLGADVALSGIDWRVVGVFDSGGDLHDSELWGDVETVLDANQREAYTSITAVLERDAAFDIYRVAISTNPELSHAVHREADYYTAQSGNLTRLMRGLGYGVAVIMALGALFSLINTLYAAVRARTREMATLRAIGFGSVPIVVSILIEALLLCLLGGIIGGALAFLMFNGYAVSTLNQQTFSQVAFNFSVTGPLLAEGILLACAIAVLGGLFPAVRAARLPVAAALRLS